MDRDEDATSNREQYDLPIAREVDKRSLGVMIDLEARTEEIEAKRQKAEMEMIRSKARRAAAVA